MDHSSAPYPAAAEDDVLLRLRRALAGSNEHERRMASLEPPLRIEDLLGPQGLDGLRPAAVLAPVLQRGDRYTVLLTRRSENLRNHSGQVSFPGGRRDATDNSIAENAMRESEEEIGLSRERIEVIGYLDDFPTHTGFLVTPVVGLVREVPEFTADPGEVAEIFEVPLPLLMDPQRYERKQMMRDGLLVPFYEVNYGGNRIWGATAAMLWNLCQKVQAL